MCNALYVRVQDLLRLREPQHAGSLYNGSDKVGFGRGPLSLVSQLGVPRFSYCLTSFMSIVPSRLYFGAYATLNTTNTSDSARCSPRALHRQPGAAHHVLPQHDGHQRRRRPAARRPVHVHHQRRRRHGRGHHLPTVVAAHTAPTLAPHCLTKPPASSGTSAPTVNASSNASAAWPGPH
ncbi:hypothetical protein QYE76_034202 [Lolium multiflorum]|uniref:Xylanase inhibitor N-terminal domain-containing protein n=1 Tax=Lolium multiflorum TaxID=4521 RepID=A0AAD8R041_LOLMU|nr:hypothetical protein QYE76_034202 [Lolium multiflorum]